MSDWNKQAARNNHDQQPHKEKKNKEIAEQMVEMDVLEEVMQDAKAIDKK
ncbi:hypothetical protein [Alkalihalobacterium alkalinitrilicum]|nr:hypothetical protein [Alkalihalobacterium alkalinitrilicum]